ncbi:MAG: hypothetical protein H7319_22880 [Spirosoma sp.]|nr:hypothetical protein [Spirosoma sp.]
MLRNITSAHNLLNTMLVAAAFMLNNLSISKISYRAKVALEIGYFSGATTANSQIKKDF